MHDLSTDPRVTARPGGGWEITTAGGTFHVLDSDVLGWGVFQGPNLDIALTADGQLAIGAADPRDLIKAVLDHDDLTRTAETCTTDVSDDTDGM